MKTKLVGAAALSLLVAACGTDPRERTTGGAAAGAATGAGVGALGGPVGVLAGAAVGGGVGAVTGAVTDPADVNLGRPVWENPETRVPGVTGSGSGRTASSRSAGGGGSASAREAQAALNSRGYDVGTPDGVWGARSQRAAEEFQRANGLPVTGRLDARTSQALGTSGGGARTAQDRDRAPIGSGTTLQPGGTPSGTGMQGTGSPGSIPGSGGGGTAMPPNATGSFGGPGNTPSGPGPGNTGIGQTQGGGGAGGGGAGGASN